MPSIKFLDPENTGSVNWYGKDLAPNKSVKLDAEKDAALISAASMSPNFFEVSGLTDDDKAAADAAKAEAAEMASREAAALAAAEEAEQAAAEERQAQSDALTKPGEAAEKGVAPTGAPQTTKKPGASR